MDIPPDAGAVFVADILRRFQLVDHPSLGRTILLERRIVHQIADGTAVAAPLPDFPEDAARHHAPLLERRPRRFGAPLLELLEFELPRRTLPRREDRGVRDGESLLSRQDADHLGTCR